MTTDEGSARMIPLTLSQLVAPSARLEKLAGGFLFTEGPLWNHQEGYLLFSDMPGDVRRRWSPDEGAVEVRRPSNKCNGMAYDGRGGLIVCEHATSRLVRESGGVTTTLASHYAGRQLNSPNDVIVASDGAIYFTDPTYGRTPGFGVERETELDVRGVYRIAPGGELALLLDDFSQPNGLCLSPDETVLYVNDTERCEIRAFDVGAEGVLSDHRTFASGIGPDPARPGAPDGMKCDEHGNVYVTGPGGVWVFAPTGERLGIIEVPEMVGNLNWGGGDWTELYIAASTSLYRMRMAVAGSPVPGMAQPESGHA